MVGRSCDLSLSAAVVPENARKQVNSWLTDGTLSDLSVSRPSSRLTWGIPVPNDNTQTVREHLNFNTRYLGQLTL